MVRAYVIYSLTIVLVTNSYMDSNPWSVYSKSIPGSHISSHLCCLFTWWHPYCLWLLWRHHQGLESSPWWVYSRLIPGHNADDLAIKVSTLPGLASISEIYQKEDGWIELSNGAGFCWIPPWGRNAFYLPIHSLVISQHQPYKLDYSNSVYGKSWVSCWK